MAAAVATPLEKEFSTIAGIDSMLSSSALGSTSITLQFALDRDIDAAAQDVQAAISRAVRNLPRDMPSPPTYRKVNPADQPILFLALTSPTLPLYALNEYAETLMAQRISTVNGVAQVQVYGAQKYAVRVKLDPMALSSKAIGIDEVAAAIESGNVNMPTGVLYGPHRAFTILASGQLNTADAYRPLIVTYRNGSPVRLGDLAEVTDSVENDKVAAWFFNGQDQQRSIILAIQRQPGTNTVAGRGGRQGAAAHVPGPTAGLRGDEHPVRPVALDQGVGHRRRVHPAADAVPGRAGDLPVPPQPLGHDHPQPGAADGDRRAPSP